MGAGFDKPSNSRYFALRFPWMLKIHGDRSLKDTISLEELQKMAKRCSEVQEDSEREETRWLGKLGISDCQVGRSVSCHDPLAPTETTLQIVQDQEKTKKSTRKRKIASENDFNA